MNRKNELDFLKLLSEIDVKHIQEKPFKKNVIFQKKPVVFAAALIMSIALGISASAAIINFISHKENVSHEYNNNTSLISEIEKRNPAPIICENDHLRLTVDTVMSDELYIHATATIEGKDAVGNSFISDRLIIPNDKNKISDSENKRINEIENGQDQIIPYMTIYSENDQYLTSFNSTSDNMYGKTGTNSEASFSFGISRLALKGNKQIKVKCNQLQSYFSEDKHMAGIYENMNFTLSTESNFDTVICQTKNGQKTVYLSETCFYENSSATGSEFFSFSVFFKDGSFKKDIKASLTSDSIFKLEQIDYVEYNNEHYYPVEIIKASRPQ